MGEPIKILIIENNKDDFYSISRYLSEIKTSDYELEWCCDYHLAEKEILEEKHDVYLIDYCVGQENGLSIIKNLRAQNFSKPMILITSSCTAKVEEDAIAQGASDFLMKDEVKPQSLERSIRYAIDRYHQQQFIGNQERKYRSLFELSIEPFAILNEKFDIIEYNPAFQQVFTNFKTSPKQATVSTFPQLFKAQSDFHEFIQTLHNEGYVKGFKTILLNDEEEIVSSISIASIPKNENAEEIFYHVAISDLTTIMKQEKELRKAEKLSLSGRMARMIAHEIRNPLTNIRLALGELAPLTTNEDAIMLNQMIERNTYRISDLIDDLLKSARPQELNKEKMDLKTIVRSALKLAEDRMDLFNVVLEKEMVQDAVMGEWDKEQMEIALVNILTNAIEAMDGVTHPLLYFSLKVEDEHPTILIRDNGKGMDKETLSSLFDPFFSNRKNGLGLGMTATLNIINMHDGKIDVRSEIGEGTEFKIQL